MFSSHRALIATRTLRISHRYSLRVTCFSSLTSHNSVAAGCPRFALHCSLLAGHSSLVAFKTWSLLLAVPFQMSTMLYPQITFRCSVLVSRCSVGLVFSLSPLAPFCFLFITHLFLRDTQYWPRTAHLRFSLLADGSTLLMIFFADPCMLLPARFSLITILTAHSRPLPLLCLFSDIRLFVPIS